MKEKIIENGIEYVRRGDYYYPNVEVPKKTASSERTAGFIKNL